MICVEASEYKPKWYKKINPIWWFGNDLEKEPPKRYYETYPHWARILNWRLRNFAYNFFNFVIGFMDKDLIIYGMDGEEQDAFLPRQEGRFIKTLIINYGIYLPFYSWWISYDNGHKQFQFYIGWYFGRFGIKCRIIKGGKNFEWEEYKIILPARTEKSIIKCLFNLVLDKLKNRL